MTDKLNCNVQSCFETPVENYLNVKRAQKRPCVPFSMVHVVVAKKRNAQKFLSSQSFKYLSTNFSK